MTDLNNTAAADPSNDTVTVSRATLDTIIKALGSARASLKDVLEHGLRERQIRNIRGEDLPLIFKALTLAKGKAYTESMKVTLRDGRTIDLGPGAIDFCAQKEVEELTDVPVAWTQVHCDYSPIDHASLSIRKNGDLRVVIQETQQGLRHEEETILSGRSQRRLLEELSSYVLSKRSRRTSLVAKKGPPLSVCRSRPEFSYIGLSTYETSGAFKGSEVQILMKDSTLNALVTFLKTNLK